MKVRAINYFSEEKKLIQDYLIYDELLYRTIDSIEKMIHQNSIRLLCRANWYLYEYFILAAFFKIPLTAYISYESLNI